jgi:hypothetical protein
VDLLLPRLFEKEYRDLEGSIKLRNYSPKTLAAYRLWVGYVPVVLFHRETEAVLGELQPPYRLVGLLLYGCGRSSSGSRSSRHPPSPLFPSSRNNGAITFMSPMFKAPSNRPQPRLQFRSGFHRTRFVTRTQVTCSSPTTTSKPSNGC